MRNEEHQLQVTIVKYLRYNKYVVFSIPNHGVRSERMGIYYRQEGLLSGVADLFVMRGNKDKNGIFIEVKQPKKYQFPAQKEFEKKCIENNYEYWVVKNLDNLITKLEEYEK